MRDDNWIAMAVNATGRLVIGFLDTVLIVTSLGLMTIGAGVFLLGISHLTWYSRELGWIGSVASLGSLMLLLCWGFSRRLSIMNQQIARMRVDLDELLRRAQP